MGSDVIESGVTQAVSQVSHEGDRLAALRRYDVLDTPCEPEFDDLVRLAAEACEAPVAVISLVEDRRQWFKAEVGLELRETSLVESICAQTIRQPGLFVVPDASKDPRFDDNPVVKGRPHLRFYAGARLDTPEGLPLGALCVLDTRPRQDLTDGQKFALQVLARQVMVQLELRRAVAERDEALTAIRQAEQRQALLVRELHHRIRNTLALVQSLLGSTARSARSIDGYHQAFSARIASMARTQTLLTEDYWQTASLQAMLEHELRPFMDEGPMEGPMRVVLDGPPVDLAADLAIPVGMALHELTSNAVRHGALSVPQGRVEVRWDLTRRDGKRKLILSWAEHDGPPVQEPRKRGFGSTLLERVLALQANAEVRIAYGREGLTFRLEAPLVEQRLVPEY
jgi:two-component sensor histidine kinase